ncbi:unnamed protein product [Linum trigynum]|uniref:galactinol--sucrose galactosyltransferase n=1 Tax=Linum trigynum TaxID=586398 RepID=A0AAV2EXZ9_9ROSI
MTIIRTQTVSNGCLAVEGKVILTGVPENVVCTPLSSASAFLGANLGNPSSYYHVFSLGVLERYRFMCLYRFKIWWMIPSFGGSGSEVPAETQLLLLEANCWDDSVDDSAPADHDDDSSIRENSSRSYILFLPVLEGQFRTSLQGTSLNELQLCVESGHPDVQTSKVSEALYVSSGKNPCQLIKDSVKFLEKHKGTFSHIDNKKMPPLLDWFGWCTWDAFYKNVNPQGIQQGLESFVNGGTPPQFVIIDDGWQDTHNPFLKDGEMPTNAIEFATRLVDIKENKQFSDLEEFIHTIKQKYGIKNVYMWHALVGYWGGLDPQSEPMKKYSPKLMFPVLSPGNKSHVRCKAMESLVKNGVGMVDPSRIHDFYNDLHTYLARCGADGVKVDIQNVLEALAFGYGGRVVLMRNYQEALAESVSNCFQDNNLIASMSISTDFLYSVKKCAIARASEDYMPRIPTLQASHVAAIAFDSILMGEIVVPDWDMFQSNHFAAEFHSAARAVGGGPIYVSDKPGDHDFEILRRLVLPDGSVLRARYPGRPTRDCLFSDPILDGKSLLKIWNLNKLSGVLGIFNCQGVGSWPSTVVSDNEPVATTGPPFITCQASPQNVEFLDEVAGEDWKGDCAVYAFFSRNLTTLPKNGKLTVTLESLKCEVLTVSPIRVFECNLEFAPIGLLDMYNSGGAVEGMEYMKDPSGSGCKIKILGRGSGRFGVYCSREPKCCRVGGEEQEFSYNSGDGLLIMNLLSGGGCRSTEAEITF